MTSKQEEKNQKILAGIRNRPDNKKCMDCSATLTQYVVSDFGTWVCSTCSGIHREFSHKVKSATMSTFTQDELKKLDKTGNEQARYIWRARWSPREFVEPAVGDVGRIREFIALTYKDKKWYALGELNQSQEEKKLSQGNDNRIAAPPSSNNTLPRRTPSQSNPVKASQSLIDWDDIPSQPTVPITTSMSSPVYTTQNNEFNPFGFNANSAQPQTMQPLQPQPMQPLQPQTNDFNPFQTGPAPVAAKPTNDFDFFGTTSTATNNPKPASTVLFDPFSPAPANNPVNQPQPTNTQPFFNGPTNNFADFPPTNTTATTANNNYGFDAFKSIPPSGYTPSSTSSTSATFPDEFDGLSISSGQRKPKSDEPFSFDALRDPNIPSFTLQPPPARIIPKALPVDVPTNAPRKNSASKANKTDFFDVPPEHAVSPKSESHLPECPMCGKRFKGDTSNGDINAHIDDCLSQGSSERASTTPPRTMTRGEILGELPKHMQKGNTQQDKKGDQWSQWFDLTKMDWYYGAINRDEAERILSRCTEDSFLVRKSSVQNSYALSLWNYRKQTCSHTLIEPKGNGFAFQDTARIYPTILDLITKSPECGGLRPPPKTSVALE